MKTTIEKTIYDGQKFFDYGRFSSLESAHKEHSKFSFQQTFEDIENMNKSIPYLHLMEFRDGEHYNDLYFTAKDIHEIDWSTAECHICGAKRKNGCNHYDKPKNQIINN